MFSLFLSVTDTASVYKNESDIGEALKKLLPEHGLQREDVFITSKLGKTLYSDQLQNVNCVLAATS